MARWSLLDLAANLVEFEVAQELLIFGMFCHIMLEIGSRCDEDALRKLFRRFSFFCDEHV